MALCNKRRVRDDYSFSNINLLGKCNVDCFFCLGKDIDELLAKQNQLVIPFEKWENFGEYIALMKEKEIKKIYITGQNTDALMYRYLDQLVDFLKAEGFTVGLRTNGYLAPRHMETINKCENSVNYSIHTLVPETNYKIMKRRDLPNWEQIIPATNTPRIAIVVNQYNFNEFFDILRYTSKFKNIRYIQARRICTDTREELLEKDVLIYEDLYNYVKDNFPKIGEFCAAEEYEIYGQRVCFWRTVQTTVNSINYFTNGTISGNYYVVEGYTRENAPEQLDRIKNLDESMGDRTIVRV